MGKISLSLFLFIMAATSFAGDITLLTKEEAKQILLDGKIDKESETTVSRHFRDRNSIYPDPRQLKFIKNLPTEQYVSGTTSSVGVLIPWGYRYEVRHRSNEILIVSRIHFKDASDSQFKKLKRNLELAANVWNENLPRGLVSF